MCETRYKMSWDRVNGAMAVIWLTCDRRVNWYGLQALESALPRRNINPNCVSKLDVRGGTVSQSVTYKWKVSARSRSQGRQSFKRCAAVASDLQTETSKRITLGWSAGRGIGGSTSGCRGVVSLLLWNVNQWQEKGLTRKKAHQNVIPTLRRDTCWRLLLYDPVIKACVNF